MGKLHHHTPAVKQYKQLPRKKIIDKIKKRKRDIEKHGFDRKGRSGAI